RAHGQKLLQDRIVDFSAWQRRALAARACHSAGYQHLSGGEQRGGVRRARRRHRSHRTESARDGIEQFGGSQIVVVAIERTTAMLAGAAPALRAWISEGPGRVCRSRKTARRSMQPLKASRAPLN